MANEDQKTTLPQPATPDLDTQPMTQAEAPPVPSESALSKPALTKKVDIVEVHSAEVAAVGVAPAQVPAPIPAQEKTSPDEDKKENKRGNKKDNEEKQPELVRAAYEHPLVIRVTHWLNAIVLFVMVTSGLRIFRAFPSFGPKIPQQDLIDIPKSLTLGGWLGGALQWHFTFMWLFGASGILYISYQLLSGHYRTVLFTPKDIPGVWPMMRHYFLFGVKPTGTAQYNPLQKLAYTSTVGFGALSLLTGVVMYKPVQFSWLAFLFGGFHLTRIWHFAAMCGFLAFIPGHLIMVALHGWSNFFSMLSGWKCEPEYQE